MIDPDAVLAHRPGSDLKIANKRKIDLVAVQNLSPALPPSAVSDPYPMALPGYGKRSAPDQLPPRADDFALLPLRERYIAGFIERLPEGAAMSVKSLAKLIPLYGQQAISSALTALSVAGHLRRVRCAVGDADQVRWVFRTFWSRTARDSEWWGNRVGAGAGVVPAPVGVAVPVPVGGAVAVPVPVAEPEPPAVLAPRTTPAPVPESATVPSPSPSPAYLALAGLGRIDARLALSAADCTVLEALAARWFARGVDADYLTGALTAGLPARVDSPVGFVRRRLTDKIPPALPTPPQPGTPVRQMMMECTECGTPGPAQALPDGLCRPCRQPQTPTDPPPPVERDVAQLVAGLRDLLKAP